MNIIKMMQETGKITELPLRYINDINKENKENLLIIITGTRSNLYSKLEALIENGLSKDNLITKQDVIAVLSPPQAGNEDHFQQISNKISRIDSIFISASPEVKLNVHPSQFDLKNYQF